VTSTSTGSVASTQWLYAGKTVNNQNPLGLTLACGDLIGSGSVRTVSVRLNVTGSDGSTGTVDNGVPVQIVGGFCP
jgi:hypothetical protein